MAAIATTALSYNNCTTGNKTRRLGCLWDVHLQLLFVLIHQEGGRLALSLAFESFRKGVFALRRLALSLAI